MTDIIWNSLLELKRLLSSCDKKNFSVQVFYTGSNFHAQVEVAEEGRKPQIKFNFNDKNIIPLVFEWDESFALQLRNEVVPETEVFKFIETYLPYCFTTLKSHKIKRTYGISHYAQSLDGKIATAEGHSKWISDQENLVHCHRMRALCDGIIIGVNTLRSDKPQLTVRHVKGNNPIKIVIGSSSASFASLMQQKEKIFLFTSKPAKILQGVNQINLPEKPEHPVFIMEHLYKLGVHSVFIEGGSYTTSSFVKNNMVDEIQLYIAPTVFGSGLSDFELPPIKHVKDAVSFSKYQFTPMGNGIFFKGELINKKRKTSKSVVDD